MIPIHVDGGTPEHRVSLDLKVYAVPRVGELLVVNDENREVVVVFHTVSGQGNVSIQVRVK